MPEQNRIKLDPATCEELSALVVQTPAALLALRWFLKGQGMATRDGRIIIDAAHVDLVPLQPKDGG
jgi:hypothetical protein